ncbi:MAG: tetratricopeptide repeat protein [bacterium]
MKAQKLLEAGKCGEAERVLRESKGGRDDARQSLVLARILSRQGQGETALQVLKEVALNHPLNAPAHLFLGILAESCDLLAEARAAFERVIQLQPENDLAHSCLALTLARLGMHKECRAEFSAHGFCDNRWFLVRLTEWMETEWLASGRFFKPVTCDFTTNQAPPKDGFFNRLRHKRRTNQSFRRKDYHTLVHQLAPALAGSPDVETVFACAFAAEMLRAYGFALECIGRLDEKRLPDPLLAARGRCLIRLGRFTEAAADLNRVLIIGPEDYGLNYYLGVLCLAHNEKARARQLFHRAYTDYLIDTFEYQFEQIIQAFWDEFRNIGTCETKHEGRAAVNSTDVPETCPRDR